MQRIKRSKICVKLLQKTKKEFFNNLGVKRVADNKSNSGKQ